MEAINVRIYPDNKEQLNAVKTIFKALKIKFEVEAEAPYDQKFVDKVLTAKQEIKEGKGVSVNLDNLWK